MKKIFVYIICSVIAFVLAFFGSFGVMESSVEDILYHNPGNINNNIRIIKIDEHTIGELGDFYEWDRSIYAKLVETLCVSEDIRPAVIGFDILFGDEKDPETDALFSEVCDEYGNVVVGFSYVFAKELITDDDGKILVDVMSVQEKVLPYESLMAATEQGFVNALMDADDGLIRNAFLYFDEADGTRVKSFDFAVYAKYMEESGKKAERKRNILWKRGFSDSVTAERFRIMKAFP
ncbi:MAG: CHASE2 domain-containing protein [Firmicutes bacterium]|nr:CHASE2 domain-containing protein [Bacillota bacterium]